MAKVRATPRQGALYSFISVFCANVIVKYKKWHLNIELHCSTGTDWFAAYTVVANIAKPWWRWRQNRSWLLLLLLPGWRTASNKCKCNSKNLFRLPSALSEFRIFIRRCRCKMGRKRRQIIVFGMYCHISFVRARTRWICILWGIPHGNTIHVTLTACCWCFFVLEVTFFLLKYFLSESVWYTDGTGLFLSWGPVIITYSMFRYSIFLFWQIFWIYCSHDDK